jgi:hypothetical protein
MQLHVYKRPVVFPTQLKMERSHRSEVLPSFSHSVPLDPWPSSHHRAHI